LGPLELGQVTGREFVGAILQQPGEQEVPRLEKRHILLVVDLSGGQQARGLEIEQSRRYDEELGRLPQVPLAGRAEVGKEFVCDLERATSVTSSWRRLIRLSSRSNGPSKLTSVT
jgi:hypothetical protein